MSRAGSLPAGSAWLAISRLRCAILSVAGQTSRSATIFAVRNPASGGRCKSSTVGPCWRSCTAGCRKAASARPSRCAPVRRPPRNARRRFSRACPVKDRPRRAGAPDLNANVPTKQQISPSGRSVTGVPGSMSRQPLLRSKPNVNLPSVASA